MFRRIRPQRTDQLGRANSCAQCPERRTSEAHLIAGAAVAVVRRQAIVLAVAGAVLGIGACSSDESAATPLPPEPALSTATAGSTAGTTPGFDSADDPQQSDDGFQAYTYLGTIEPSVIYRIDLEVSECLRGQGFEWTPEPLENQAALETTVSDFLRPPSMDEIRQFGYAYKTGRLRLSSTGASGDEAELSAQLVGAKEACTTQVVSGSPYARWLTLSGQAQDAVADAEERVRTRPEFLAVEQQWSSCVAQGGYQLARLDDGEDVEWPSDDDPRAIEMAVRDYQCRFDVGLFDVENRLLDEEAATWREANPGLIEEMDALRAELTAYAAG